MKTLDTLRRDARAIAIAGIRAVDAGLLVQSALTRLTAQTDRVWIVAAGKAAVPMTRGAVAFAGARIRGGVVVAPDHAEVPAPLEFVRAEHPHPGEGSEKAGRRALEIARAVPADDLLLVLVSGGASSLLTVPAPGLTLADKRATTGVLLRSGADIYALNTVRKHLSAVKGGRLAMATPARCLALVLSDVVGDDLSVIASGPTVPDASTFDDALRVLDEAGGRAAYPPAVVAHLEGGRRAAAAASAASTNPHLANTTTILVGGRRNAMAGARAEAERLAYAVHLIEEPVLGEARLAGPAFVEAAVERAVRPGSRRPHCVIASGETTVRVRGHGQGGRNQELVLAAIDRLAAEERRAVLVSVGTDGVDGPTDAAGAVADNQSLARALRVPLSPEDYLNSNDAYAFFQALDDLILIGPTGTNVGDLQVFLLA